MICETCGKEFFEDWRKYPRGEPRFCSRVCSTSYSRNIKREETNRKVSEKLSQGKTKYCSTCGSKLSYNNKSGFCKNCKPPKTKPTKKDNRKRSKVILEHRRRRKRDLVEYKGGACEICGYDKCIRALEFHHKNGDDKKYALSKLGNTRSWETDREEVDKCILVCANCHREIHDREYNKNSGE
jgi:hypothetical protein